MPDTSVLSKSVTANDYNADPRSGILHFYLPQWGQLGTQAPDLPPFWSLQRDAILLGTLYRESIWASAVTKTIARQVSKSFKVQSDITLRAKRAQELFLEFDSQRGWVGGLSKHLQSYLLTGNGGHIEIVRATAAVGGRILGLIPLDSLRCIRTGDPDFPIIYRDRMGNEHIMRDYQVFSLADMPDQSELWFGVGHSSAERAYTKIVTMEALERYLSEKLTGRAPTVAYIINGLKQGAIEQLIQTAQEDASRKGLTNFMGPVIGSVIDPNAKLGLLTIPLKEVPDGFNAEQERAEAKLAYADALGIDPQSLDPRLISRGALGGAQSIVLEDKAHGAEAWPKDWVHACDLYVLDDKTTFFFEENDLRDDKLKAEVMQTRADALKTMTDAGFITAQQGTQVLVDENELPKEFLPFDATPGDSLDDEEKPAEDTAAATALVPQSPATPALPAPQADLGQEIKNMEYYLDWAKVSMQRAKELNLDRQADLALTVSAVREAIAALRESAALKQIESPPAPPTIVVNVPEQPAPLVTVNVQPPVINIAAPVVNVEAELTMPEMIEESTFTRDANGLIVGKVQRTKPA